LFFPRYILRRKFLLFFHKGGARFDGFLFRDLGELLSDGVLGLFIFAGIPSLFQLALSRFLNQQLDRSAIRFERRLVFAVFRARLASSAFK
jgi:hypothetical protein